MIELIATIESVEQAKRVLEGGADKIVTGEAVFGLRLPGHLTDTQMAEVIAFAHKKGKKLWWRPTPFYTMTKLPKHGRF
ncbi:hypothetical protein [Fundicoccus culcitae]|uniref:hypothetical protein n=1 Tax=Fundicoccus culcitae TaxID=2969821 RepID=UPI0028BF0E19|nr:hypothetical protein [Fundicoccus culcitae]